MIFLSLDWHCYFSESKVNFDKIVCQCVCVYVKESLYCKSHSTNWVILAVSHHKIYSLSKLVIEKLSDIVDIRRLNRGFFEGSVRFCDDLDQYLSRVNLAV